MLVGRGLALVLGDLAALGFDARWGVLGAVDAGAPHRRERIWIVANADSQWQLQPQRLVQQERRRPSDSGQDVASTDSPRLEKRQGQSGDDGTQQQTIERTSWWESEPELGRVAHGVACRVDRLRAIGNGQIPAVVRLAWQQLKGFL